MTETEAKEELSDREDTMFMSLSMALYFCWDRTEREREREVWVQSVVAFRRCDRSSTFHCLLLSRTAGIVNLWRMPVVTLKSIGASGLAWSLSQMVQAGAWRAGLSAVSCPCSALSRLTVAKGSTQRACEFSGDRAREREGETHLQVLLLPGAYEPGEDLGRVDWGRLNRRSGTRASVLLTINAMVLRIIASVYSGW